MLSTMATGDSSQTTQVQILHVFMLCCSTQIVCVYNFDSCEESYLLHGVY